MAKLTCDMVDGCPKEVVYIDNKGWTYCSDHGVERKASGIPTRKLTRAEVGKLERGETISYRRARKESRNEYATAETRTPEEDGERRRMLTNVREVARDMMSAKGKADLDSMSRRLLELAMRLDSHVAAYGVTAEGFSPVTGCRNEVSA